MYALQLEVVAAIYYMNRKQIVNMLNRPRKILFRLAEIN